jgi:hypothetical protein
MIDMGNSLGLFFVFISRLLVTANKDGLNGLSGTGRRNPQNKFKGGKNSAFQAQR